MVDGSVLVPTHRHVRLLPLAIASALDQRDASVEVLVVGDGVEDPTREIVAGFADDPRVRFFDFPKGPRLGEAYRHAVLAEASGRIVTYLADDDLLVPGHVAEMTRLLEGADLAHPPSVRMGLDGELQYFPWSFARPEFREAARDRRGSIGLTGTSHTLAAYRRLPHGWRTTPEGMPTDHYMWLQFLEVPRLRVASGERLTYLAFPDPVFGELGEDDRAALLADWFRRSREPRFDEELERLLGAAIRRAAEDYHLWARREHRSVQEFRASRTWRLRDRLLGSRIVDAIARRPRS